MPIPVIDIFAGPGGLGEGFSSIFDEDGERVFKTVLSIEMEEYAHQTLTLRCFYRQFNPLEVPEEYYQVLRNELTISELYDLYPNEYNNAKSESRKAELGNENSVQNEELDEWIVNALQGEADWVLTGGPPCQAYSVVGRSRRQETVLDAEKDERVDLYKQYLRILAFHNPAVFVMENVKGLLSANSKDSPIFKKILHDLKDPVNTLPNLTEQQRENLECPGYTIYALTRPPRSYDLVTGEPEYRAKDFLIKCEEYGIPQTRHRVILLGIRNGFEFGELGLLEKTPSRPLSSVLNLPRVRSGLSKLKDNDENWRAVIKIIAEDPKVSKFDQSTKLYCKNIFNIREKRRFLRQWNKKADILKIYKVFDELSEMDLNDVAKEMKTAIKEISKTALRRGAEFISEDSNSNNIQSDMESWFADCRIGGYSNHESRGHMATDLFRYLFVSSFGSIKDYSPKLKDFPINLLPAHKNVKKSGGNKFADRFRVQVYNKPSKTITSHISKDGHYFIHPDPAQCRSFTVREAARIQTFPDNYFFYGPRTSQYIQVGNAVPPLLAKKIAEIVSEIF